MIQSNSSLVVAQQRQVEIQSDLRKLFSEWDASLELRVKTAELSGESRRTYLEGARRFIDWCIDYPAVSDDVIREWMADMRGAGIKPSTVNTWLSGLRSFLTWAVGARKIPYNPSEGVRGAKRKDSRKHKRDKLTDYEVRRVLALPDDSNIGRRDNAILRLMLYTGVRTIEVHRADLKDLSTKSGKLVLSVTGKGHEESDDFVVIEHPSAESAIYDWLAVRGERPGALFTSLSQRTKNKRLALSSIREIVKSYYKLAGIKETSKTTHSLRHTAISSAVKHNAPIPKVKSMARHASIDTTMIYVHEEDRIENPAERFIDYGE